VHRKEQNVHKKKNDFESLRKELEVVLANLLSEFFTGKTHKESSQIRAS